MASSRQKPYPKRLKELMAAKSRILSQAQTCSELGMEELAVNLWQNAAAQEERIAPLLETLGRHLEAALHRVSAASGYQKAGDLIRAANLYRAALAGPLNERTRVEVERFLTRCLRKLARLSLDAGVL